MNHNLQWKNRCDALMREVEDANRHLEEYKQLTEQKLLEEREKTSRAEVSSLLSSTLYLFTLCK